MPSIASLRMLRLMKSTLATLWIATIAGTCVSTAENWPNWRGLRLDGTSTELRVPVTWSPTNNLAWHAELPGLGHASPIVWGDHVFLVTCVPEREERVLLCLDLNSGKVLWQQGVLKSPLEMKHPFNSHASSTPSTDGERVFVTFLDKKEVFVAAYDFAGQRLWEKRPGVFSSKHGFCSSPMLYRDSVIVNCDHDGDGYIVALAREDGRELWRIDRPNKTRSYCAPLIRTVAGREQMVLTGTKCVASYDPRNGRLHWMIDGPTEQFVASPVFNERTGLIYITGGFPDHHILAIQPDGEGNVSQSHIRWRTNKGVAYVPSPICEGDWFLTVSDSGVGFCFNARTGDIAWQERMGETHASLVSANGLVYFTNDEGVTRVVRPGLQFELIAQNNLGEKVFASPAISGGRLLIRGERNLFCMAVRD